MSNKINKKNGTCKDTLERIEGTIKNEQSRDTGNIWHKTKDTDITKKSEKNKQHVRTPPNRDVYDPKC